MEKNRYALGIGLNLFDARAIFLKEDGKILAEVKKDRTNISANETLKVLIELFEEILSATKKYKHSIEGVGIALGGIVNNKKGVVYWPQVPDSYIAVPLRDYLEKKFDFPVLIENDATACAWAEYMMNFPKCKNLIYLFSGVGCGMIIDGKLYKGSDGGAGELFLNSHKTMSSPLGDFSFFKHWPADLGMVKAAERLISLGNETGLVKKISPTGELSLEDIFNEARKKDRVAKDTMKEAAFSLGVKIAFLVNLLNPDTVIIGGGLEKAGEFFLEECTRVVKRFAFNEMSQNCKFFLSQLGADATSLGAATLVFKENTLQR
jgi:glucokinase